MTGLTLQSLLETFPTTHAAIKANSIVLVRHQMNNWDGFNSLLRFNKDVMKAFTASQGKDIFGCNKLILTFTPEPNKRALLSAAFINHGLIDKHLFTQQSGYDEYCAFRKSINLEEEPSSNFFYHLEVCKDLEDLFDRLIIDWGDSTISWYQRKLNKNINQILAQGFVKPFTGWQDVLLTYQELTAIINNEEGNPDWAFFLKNNDGVYLILDNLTGQHYVGSATAEGSGIWGRWAGYVQNGHNGNKLLKKLIIENGQTYARNFSFSLHHVSARGSNSKKKTIHYESLLKKKLGSRVFGLNGN